MRRLPSLRGDRDLGIRKDLEGGLFAGLLERLLVFQFGWWRCVGNRLSNGAIGSLWSDGI